MDLVWGIYWSGVICAFIWFASDFYTYNVKRGVHPRMVFNNLNDIRDLFLLSLGSWLSFLFIVANNDD